MRFRLAIKNLFKFVNLYYLKEINFSLNQTEELKFISCLFQFTFFNKKESLKGLIRK